jgi:hypothetical protein
MGTWLRDLNGYRRSYRQHITFAELAREFPQMHRPRGGALVPDPWDDYFRYDLDDRTSKRHRATRYRSERTPPNRNPLPHVMYDSSWMERRYCYGVSPSDRRIQFRVRFAYRRHRE